MFWDSPGLALIELACRIAIGGVTWLGARRLFRTQSAWQEIDERLAGLVLQSINAVPVPNRRRHQPWLCPLGGALQREA